jgi:hypothetical protein
LLLVTCAVVTLPLGWGLYQSVMKSRSLFTAPTAAPVASNEAARDAGTDAAITAPKADESPPATFAEARRARLTTLDDEPGLAKNADAIRAHFGGTLPPSMDLQAVALGAGKQALLLRETGDDSKPIALLVDASGTAVWIKERPLAGITPPARPFAIAPRPDNGVALFVYDPPTKLVAARMWTPEGAPFADLVLFDLARCDAIAAAWWPGRGWIVVTSFQGGARAQLLNEEGSPAWDAHGVAVGEAWRAPTAATIVIDSETPSWILVQHATRNGADHVIAIRYGTGGARLDDNPVDLGVVARVAHPLDRIDATLVGAGIARIDVGGKPVMFSFSRTP